MKLYSHGFSRLTSDDWYSLLLEESSETAMATIPFSLQAVHTITPPMLETLGQQCICHIILEKETLTT